MSSNTNIPFVIKANGAITLYLQGECMTVAQDHPNYNKIVDALKKGENDKIQGLINISKAVTNYGKGLITVSDGQVFYAGRAVHNTLTERILKMMAEGFKVDHMLLFLQNLMSNPSFRAVNETYTFLENHGLPITDDGCFLAYKAVQNNYTDMRTGKFDNSVGKVVRIARNQVDENYHADCSYGLHVGALEYVVQFGGFRRGQAPLPNGNKLLIVKVNPRDVVSVPEYAGHTKMRVCEYAVVDEIKDVVKELDKVSVYKADATPAEPDYVEDDDLGYDDSEDDYSEECQNDCDCRSVTKKSSVDTTSPWNEEKYREGFRLGRDDVDNDREYGFSRDYSEVNSYRIGYNDGYNDRDNQADLGGEHADTADNVDSLTEDDDREYNAGYVLGVDDASYGCYQASLDIDASDAFKAGYYDGYNDNK